MRQGLARDISRDSFGERVREAAGRLCAAVFVMVVGLAGVPASAQQTLSAPQVLVVYDSRIADSLAVAEHYAGSAVVPGGTGGEPGARAGVRVFDLASSAPVSSAVNGGIFRDGFKAELRDPIRQHLIDNDLVYRVRCLVLCKGRPHRLDDALNPGAGDQAANFGQLWSTGRARAASVDSELTLLWQDMDEIQFDAFRTVELGYFFNPYRHSTRPINTYSNKDIRAEKNWDAVQAGLSWKTSGDDESALITPGDMLLVCRLDGHTVAGVRAMVERAANVVYDPDNSAFIIDESGSNGVADSVRNSELDNVMDPLTNIDDYETARDTLLADGRFDSSLVLYNGDSGHRNFYVGPHVDFDGRGEIVEDPIVLLTHFGRNHQGRPLVNIDKYEESFNYGPGAVFNTLESFNGRAFNGLGTLTEQAQVADFIAAGGTFGIGHVYEPFAQTLPDTTRLVNSFFLGRLTWAESAYTAIPCVSWMHVVIGDPLARAIVASEDVNGDGVLDIEDLYAFSQNPVDLNRDGTIDDADRLMLAETIRNPDQQTHDAGRGLLDAIRDAD